MPLIWCVGRNLVNNFISLIDLLLIKGCIKKELINKTLVAFVIYIIVSITSCGIAYLWGKLPVSSDTDDWNLNLKKKLLLWI